MLGVGLRSALIWGVVPVDFRIPGNWGVVFLGLQSTVRQVLSWVVLAMQILRCFPDPSPKDISDFYMPEASKLMGVASPPELWLKDFRVLMASGLRLRGVGGGGGGGSGSPVLWGGGWEG